MLRRQPTSIALCREDMDDYRYRQLCKDLQASSTKTRLYHLLKEDSSPIKCGMSVRAESPEPISLQRVLHYEVGNNIINSFTTTRSRRASTQTLGNGSTKLDDEYDKVHKSSHIANISPMPSGGPKRLPSHQSLPDISGRTNHQYVGARGARCTSLPAKFVQHCSTNSIQTPPSLPGLRNDKKDFTSSTSSMIDISRASSPLDQLVTQLQTLQHHVSEKFKEENMERIKRRSTSTPNLLWSDLFEEIARQNPYVVEEHSTAVSITPYRLVEHSTAVSITQKDGQDLRHDATQDDMLHRIRSRTRAAHRNSNRFSPSPLKCFANLSPQIAMPARLPPLPQSHSSTSSTPIRRLNTRTPTSRRVRVYDDDMPSILQPQTPADFGRHGSLHWNSVSNKDRRSIVTALHPAKIAQGESRYPIFSLPS